MNNLIENFLTNRGIRVVPHNIYQDSNGIIKALWIHNYEPQLIQEVVSKTKKPLVSTPLHSVYFTETPTIGLIFEGLTDLWSIQDILITENITNIALITFGTANLTSTQKILLTNLSKNTNIHLLFDNDDPGKKAVQSLKELIPNLKAITPKYKDINKWLIEDRGSLTDLIYNLSKDQSNSELQLPSIYEI